MAEKTIGSTPYASAPDPADAAALNANFAELYGSIGAACETFGASPTASSAVNTAAIQAALNAGGTVTLLSPGVFPIDSTLTIKADTRFLLGHGVTLQAVTGGARGVDTFPAIISANAMSAPVAISTMAGAAYSHYMVEITVSFASAHGLTLPGYIEIKGDGQGIYNGVWKLNSVPSSTTATFLMSIAAGSTNMPPPAATPVASAFQTVANPGVFTTATQSFLPGQLVQITGTAPGGFSTGTNYYVIANGLTSTTCQLAQSPYAASGIAVSSSSACTIVPQLIGAPADGNITVEGGTYDMNFGPGGFTASGDYHDHCIILRRVLRPSVRGVYFNDVRHYAIMAQDTQDLLVTDIDGASVADCCHIYGPAWNPVVKRVRGTWGDDIVPIQTVDAELFTPQMLGSGNDLGGDIWNAAVEDIRASQTHNSGVVVFYPNGDTGGTGRTSEVFRIRGNTSVRGASSQVPYVSSSWFGGFAVSVGGGYVTVPGAIEDLSLHGTAFPSLNNVGASTVLAVNKISLFDLTNDLYLGSTLVPQIQDVNIGQFDIYSPNFSSAWDGYSTFLSVVGSSTSVDCINIFGGKFEAVNNNGLNVVQIAAGAAVQSVNFYGTRFKGASSGSAVVGISSDSSGCTLGTLNAVGITLDQYSRLHLPTTWANVPTLNISGVGLANYSDLVDLTGNQSLNVNINGFSSTTPLNGIFNFFGRTGGTIALRINGLAYSGALYANFTGTIQLFNPDGSFPIDGSLLTVAPGSMFYNTNAAYSSGVGFYACGTVATRISA